MKEKFNEKLWKECLNEISKKYLNGTTLVTGHKSEYWKLATILYLEKIKKNLTNEK